MSEKYLGEEGTSRLIAKVKGYSQPRTLVSPITIGGQSQTTVETALSALNNAKCEQVNTMPTAGSSYLNKVYQFIGTTTSSFKSGCFYKCVSDGGDPAVYSWELLVGDIPVDNTTIVKDGTTGELTAVQATTSTLGVVKGGDGTQISNAGGINVVNRLEETDALPTAASTNLNKCYLLKGTQTGYQTGAIYQCRLVAGSDPTEYEWVLISANPLTFDSDDFNVANDNVELQPSRRTYKGTRAAWDLLSVAEKKTYGAAAFTDDEDLPSNMVLLTEITPIDTQWHFDPNPIDISQFSYIYAEGLDASGARTGGNVIIPKSLFEHCTPTNPFLLMRGGLGLSNCCLICQTAVDNIGLYTGAAVYADGTVIVKAKFYGIK